MAAPGMVSAVPQGPQAPPEMTAALQRLKIWEKLKQGEIHMITKDNIQELFSVLDTEGRGEIPKESLQVIRSVPNITLTEEDVSDLANDCDKDGSGRLSMDELYKAFTQGELAFSMVKDSLGKKAQAIDDTSLNRKDVIEFLQEEYETQSALWSLPMTFVLFVTFMMLQTVHMQIARSWENQHAVRSEIVGEGPPYLTEHEWAIVHDIPTLWEWLSTSWVSSHFKQPVSDVFPYPGRFVSFNQIIGGVQFKKTQVIAPAPCDQGPVVSALYDTGNMNGIAGECHRGDEIPLEQISEFFLYHETSDHIHEKLANMSAASWLNQNTTELDVTMLLYNANQQVFTDCHLYFTFIGSGRVFIHFDFETWRSEPYKNMMYVIPDLIFGLILFRMFYQELKELVPACMSGLDGLMNYMEFWNIVDWTAIGLGIVVMSMWGQVCTLVSSDLQAITSELPMETLDNMVLENGTYLTYDQVDNVMNHTKLEDTLSRLHEMSAGIASQHENLRMTIFFYSFVLMMKFFKAFQANPRLEIVTETLRRATEDIIHFMIIFLVIFFCFSCAGFVVFGRAIRGFSTQFRSMVTCWKILMGDFDIDEMSLVHPLLAPTWMVSFQFLVLLILLNMLLAIIMDTYMAAKTSKGAMGLTIWAQIREAIRTVRETRGHMDYWNLIVELTDDDYPAHNQPIVTSKSLRRAFPKMTKHNAEYIMRKTAEFIRSQADECDLTMNDAIRLIGLIKTTTLRTASDTESILDIFKSQMQAPQKARFEAIWDDPNAKLGAPGTFPQSQGMGMQTGMMNQGMGMSGGPMGMNGMGMQGGMGGPMGMQGGMGGMGGMDGMNGMNGMPPNGMQGANGMPPGSMINSANMNSMMMKSTMGPMGNSGFGAGAGAAAPTQNTQAVANMGGMMDSQAIHEIRAAFDRNHAEMMNRAEEIRKNQEEQRVWFDTKLCALERRMDKVERGNERIVGNLQQIDFTALTTLPDKMDAWAPRMEQVRQQGTPLLLTSNASGNLPRTGSAYNMMTSEADEDRSSSAGSREQTFQEENTVLPGRPDLPSTEMAPLGQVRAGSVQKVTSYLETIMAQMETLVAAAEDSVESRRLLWKIDLGVRQLREKAGAGALGTGPGSPQVGPRSAGTASSRRS